ncbi:MAG: hypothetical protein RJA99_4294 [Pseudomonadota bacterium]|jgi:antitoxin CcdA
MANSQSIDDPPEVAIRRTGKRAANLSLSADVLEAARRLRINVSRVCDEHLREVVRREEARRWKEANADFIGAYNATVEVEGLPLDAWRSF